MVWVVQRLLLGVGVFRKGQLVGARPSSFKASVVDVPAVVARVWSEQQERFFRWFDKTLDWRGNPESLPGGQWPPMHLLGRARAGTGKTTTIAEGVNRAPEQNIWVCAFGKQTQKALAAAITNPNAETTTVHAMGRRFIRRRWPRIEVETTRGARANQLTSMVCDESVPKPIRNLISNLHTKGREMLPLHPTLERLIYLAEFFDLVPDEAYVDYDVSFVADHALMAMMIAASDAPTKEVGIDFADMVYLPLVWDLITKDFELVVADEAQDLTESQLTFIQRACSGRICIMGDDRQAIFYFRGADKGSLDRLKNELQAVELPLKVTYRCCQVVVRRAQLLVPDIEAAPGNPEGVEDQARYWDMLDQAQPGDFILSRLNAPLVVLALRLLIQGRRARMEGRDIGAGILGVLNRLKVGTYQGIPKLLVVLEQWERKSTTKFLSAGLIDLADRCRDQAAMIRAFAERAESIQDLRDRIDWLFKDSGTGSDEGFIICSSIHKAKGLEADHVWVLQESLYRRGPSEEEDNCHYVATTRAKSHLTWVTGVPRLCP